jgi:phage shock protein A
MKNLDDKIQTEKQKCQEYGKTIQQSNTIQEEIESNITTLEKADVEINTHHKGLIVDLSKSRSREELKYMIRAFDRQMQGDVRELEDLESTVQHIESLIEKGKEKKITLSGEKGELMGEEVV